MKAAIVLALIGSVLAAPPLRQMQKPNHDQYAHIFAQVRPPGQKPQNVELQFHQQNVAEGQLTQNLEAKEHHQHHQSSAQGQVLEVQMRPVEQKPQHVVEVEIKQQHPNSSPNHWVELEVKPVEQKPQHVVEVEIKQQQPNSYPNHQIEAEKRPQQPHYQNSAQGHLVSLAAKPVEQKPQNLAVDHQPELPQYGNLMVPGNEMQLLSLNQRQ